MTAGFALGAPLEQIVVPCFATAQTAADFFVETRAAWGSNQLDFISTNSDKADICRDCLVSTLKVRCSAGLDVGDEVSPAFVHAANGDDGGQVQGDARVQRPSPLAPEEVAKGQARERLLERVVVVQAQLL